MTQTFTKHKCGYCGEVISSSGLGKTSHYRKHAREGLCVEIGYKGRNYSLHWVPVDAYEEGKIYDGLWKSQWQYEMDNKNRL